MLRRLDGEESRPALSQPHAAAIAPEAAVPAIGESEAETSLLPRDHPKWARDAVTVSQRAREIIARLRPVAIKILTFWDHRVRSAFIGGARVSIDPSGSYRVE
ncbi:MAG TPA: hypothetical protein VMG98_09050 [Verrucomicrobiae bacterium]|nr:hypothetical protein [Verrucomicrobiae bacterium]